MNDWNRVEDKLPEEGVLIEIYVSNLGHNFGRFFGYYGEFLTEVPVWVCQGMERLTDVTHWRVPTPVPE